MGMYLFTWEDWAARKHTALTRGGEQKGGEQGNMKFFP